MMTIGKIGIWFVPNARSIAESVAFAQKVEACSYGALWVPEAIGREPFVHLYPAAINPGPSAQYGDRRKAGIVGSDREARGIPPPSSFYWKTVGTNRKSPASWPA